MNLEFLKLTPTRFLCPYCHNFHSFDTPFSPLQSFNIENKAVLSCPNTNRITSHGHYEFYFENGYIHYLIMPICDRYRLQTYGSFQMKNVFTPVVNNHQILFFGKHLQDYNLDFDIAKCAWCSLNDKCDFRYIHNETYKHGCLFPLGFEFEESLHFDSPIRNDSRKNIDSKNEEKKDPNKLKENVGNPFNINIKFGINKDSNIASTILGIAVKNEDTWCIYDKEENKITNIIAMPLGNLPTFVMPSMRLTKGDLIKDDGEYYFVTNIEDGFIQTLHVKTGELRKIIPIENAMGLKFYQKIIALNDYIDTKDEVNKEKFVILSSIFEQYSKDGNQMNQMLPLLFLNDVINSGEQIDIFKMMTMCSTMGNNLKNSNDPFINYLILDKLISKKN